MIRRTVPALTAAFAIIAGIAGADAKRPYLMSYDSIVNRVASMVSDREAQSLAQRHGLQVLNVLWEDTGRWQGSSVGPNISDVTIEVSQSGEERAGIDSRRGRRMALMPVLRFPNFRDKTADIRLDRFFVKVGNERKGRREKVISLKELLAHPMKYMSLPDNGRIKGGTLLAERDTH